MFETLHAFIHVPVVQGALSGFAIAASVDYVAFRKWKRWEDFRAFDWDVATFRWFQGVIVGAATAIGFGLI